MYVEKHHRIEFPPELRPNRLREVVLDFWRAWESCAVSIELDFSRVTAAWPNTMLPIIAQTDHFRQRGQQFRYGQPH